MTFDDRNLAGLADRLRGLRVCLFHGDDVALVADRAREFVRHVVDGRTGLFEPIELTGSDHTRALSAMGSPMLGGGAPIVRLRDAGEAAAASVEAILAKAADGLLVIEAGALTKRSRLRTLVEASDGAAAVMCRPADSRSATTSVTAVLAEFGVTATPAARSMLAARPGYGEPAHDAEKAGLLLAGSGRAVDEAVVISLDQDTQAGALEDFVFAAMAGRQGDTDRLMSDLLAEGTAPIAVIRALLGHAGRVRMVRVALDGGAEMASALTRLRPPVFFRRALAMRETILRWRSLELDEALRMLWRADRMCRETAAPSVPICQLVVWRLVHHGAGVRA